MSEAAVTSNAAPADHGFEPSGEAAPPDIAISTRDLSKSYRIERVRQSAPHQSLWSPLRRLFRTRARRQETDPKEFWALDGVTFNVARGEHVAIIGRNGAGKSTLLKILSRIVLPTRGEARIRGTLTSLLEVGVGFDNKLSGRENVYVNASMHGLSKRQTDQRFNDIVEFSGIDTKFLDMRVKHYSSGMRVRLAFSVAAHLDPDILLLDEVLSVGDAAFQEKCLERVDGMIKEKRTLLFVSHNMSAVTRFCSRALWLEQGRVILDGSATEVTAAYSEEARKSVTTRRWTPPAEQDGACRTTPLEPSAPSSPPAETGAGGVPSGQGASEQVRFAPDGTVEEPPAARLVSVCVIDKDGRETRAITANQRIGIEFVYEVLRPGLIILPGAKFFNDDAIQLFTAVYTDPEYMQKPKSPGRYLSILWIPPHLFNVGRVHVTVNITTPGSGKLDRHVTIDRAVAFEVFEAPFGEPSARGIFKGLKGVMRPLCDWETRVT